MIRVFYKAAVRNAVLLILAGAAHALAFEPGPLPASWLAVTELLMLTILAIVILRTRTLKAAAAQGFLFTLASFSLGLYWIFVSVHTYGQVPTALSVGAVLALSTILAVFPAAGCLLARLVSGPPIVSHRWMWRAAFAFAAAWGLTEWLRETVLTGFPWLNIGYAYVDSPLAGWAPLAGVDGVSIIAAFSAVALALCTVNLRRAVPLVVLAAVLWIAGIPLHWVSWSHPAGQAIAVRLVQGNIPQSDKFDPDLISQGLIEHLELANRPPSADAPPPSLIVLPETAIPVFQDSLTVSAWEEWINVARNHHATMVVGVPLRQRVDDQTRYTNSVVGITADSTPQDLRSARVEMRYDKRHLVPFGEFVPPDFQWLVDALNIPLGNFNTGSARQRPFDIDGQHIAFNICYEDLFGADLLPELHVGGAGDPGATILANVSNLGWFGNTWALRQHLQISRMRALETARPVMIDGNTGITAVIDAKGNVQSRLPSHVAAILDTTIQGMTGMTPYAWQGNALPLIAVLILLLIAIILRSGTPKTKPTKSKARDADAA